MVEALKIASGLLLALFASYRLFPLSWAPLLLSFERVRAGLRVRCLSVGGRSFRYLEGGRGAPLVMLHGFGADADHWPRMARALTRHFHVVAPDLPGFGGTTASPSESFHVPLQAARVRAFLRALGLQRYHLVANSMGGNVAGVLANEHPDEVVSLTLMEPQGIEAPIPSEMDVLVRAGQAPLVPARPADFDHLVELAFVKRPFIPRAVYLHLRHQALTLAPLHRRIWNDLWSPEHLYLLEQNLPGIRAPTLVIWGDSDRFLHASTLEKLMTGLRDVQVVRMRACGHAPMLERPAEAARHFVSFVARLAERPATQN